MSSSASLVVDESPKAQHFVAQVRKNVLVEIWLKLKFWWEDFWGWFWHGDPTRSNHHLRRLLEVVDEVFRAHGIEYWQDYGNLLGCVRHSQIIPWDFDLDTGVTKENYAKVLALSNQDFPQGFEIAHGKEGYTVVYYRLSKEKYFWLDVVPYLYFPETKMYQPKLKGCDDPENRADYCPPIHERFLFPLRRGRMYDRDYPIPQNPDAYLTIVYGNYWRLHMMPVLFSFAYHPIFTTRFLLRYWANRRNLRNQWVTSATTTAKSSSAAAPVSGGVAKTPASPA